MRPYQDKLNGNIKIREFDLNISNNELVWHRDEKDRHVTVLEGKGWYFQRDNELPLELKENDSIFIPKLTYHRVIKGSTPLKIKIQE
jgi:quercetin dioxygenase-like cupin family protein